MKIWKEKFILYNEIQTDYENIKNLWINSGCWIYLHRSIKKKEREPRDWSLGRLGGGGGGGACVVNFGCDKIKFTWSP